MKLYRFCDIFFADDILWFKPVELRTKWGRRGHIKEALGEKKRETLYIVYCRAKVDFQSYKESHGATYQSLQSDIKTNVRIPLFSTQVHTVT